ncbi:uncharacterized protein HMPREF1541_05200 [Cyphellophora europaea CBS 101466]|uniref:Enoyl-CoA hydratase/isomerase n=1 Tax=Cyphellophora europaea (strain CBS 101466) TaxID=1220924 RepID=W2RX90_CYPE1|nr:uncharacterized protein HMPREF1541_05200 [Cyphellophora europaea CBS 101466]ETN40920.1 hypothetical protein HMPREF1541_05200 [Cyphellophora europaea CBS 101466]
MSFEYVSIDKAGEHGNIYIITMNKPPENRLNVAMCQELIRAYRTVEAKIGPDADGAVILNSHSPKFFTTGLDLYERDTNTFASSDGFYPLLHTVLDFPFPTIALITGHVFGGACLLTLAHDYRVMNSRRGFWQMPPVNAGLHHDGMGSLLRLKLGPRVARKALLQAHKFTGKEALADGIVDVVAEPEEMLGEALKVAEMWKGKARMGVYAMLRDELWGEARAKYAANSYVHRKETARAPKVKL